MSTRSNIVIKRKNGNVDSIYCHNDGYLSYNGRILLEYYTDLDKINKLINLGDISSLRKNVEPNNNNGHTFESPQQDVVVAYGRDRGEEGIEAVHFDSLVDYLKDVDTLFIEYIYLYDEQIGKWYYTDKTYDCYKNNKQLTIKDFVELTTSEIEKEGV